MIRIILINWSIFLFIVASSSVSVFAKVYSGENGDTINLTNKSSHAKSSGSKKFTYDTQFDHLIEKYSVLNNIDPFLVKCLIKAESDFKPGAVSVAGAAGLMQLMQETASCYGVTDRSDPEQNIRAGTAHLSSLLREFHGEIPLSLAAYHAGSGRVKRAGAVPPIKATIDYVNVVMRFYNGSGEYESVVKKLYRKMQTDGTINISDR